MYEKYIFFNRSDIRSQSFIQSLAIVDLGKLTEEKHHRSSW